MASWYSPCHGPTTILYVAAYYCMQLHSDRESIWARPASCQEAGGETVSPRRTPPPPAPQSPRGAPLFPAAAPPPHQAPPPPPRTPARPPTAPTPPRSPLDPSPL